MARQWNKVPQLSLLCLLVLPQRRRRSTALRGRHTTDPFSHGDQPANNPAVRQCPSKFLNTCIRDLGPPRREIPEAG